MLTIGQNGILRFGFRNGGCGIFLGLNGQGYDLCSLCFKLGAVFFQPTELVYAKTSSMNLIKHQDDHLAVLHLISQAHHVPVAVGQGEVGGCVPGARAIGCGLLDGHGLLGLGLLRRGGWLWAGRSCWWFWCRRCGRSLGYRGWGRIPAPH